MWQKQNKKLQEIKLNFFISLISLIMAIVVGAIVIAALGSNPLEAYGALLKGAFGTPMAATITLTKSVPLILTGLAIALAFKCTVFNIGVEGQLLTGAMAAAIVGAYVQLPTLLHIPLTLISAMVAGMVWAFFPAFLRQKRNVHVVISTIMFNYIGQYLVQYLILGPFKGEGAALATKRIYSTAVLPKLLPAPYVVNFGIIIAIISILVVYTLLNKTSMGYEMRAVGLNSNAAYTNGINVEKNMFLALLLSGALAGLAGGIEVTGSLGRIVNGFSPGYGFKGIPVALMARNNPFIIFFTALLLGTMDSGSLMMQSSVGVSRNMVDIIQGLIVVFLCSEYVIRYYIKKRHNQGGKEYV
ncbi:ABC transporter permease [Natronincola ferrireducens]|uniref:Nucleoside ABC transporter membrane protein n=1 Tax=Natronincola ferrireducens TaxID=393762 RepID=A0A1G9GV04_9FIRM|nr:ABC transporter permease [Natronincola ferrireducens]SDL04507.1 nucleoside ABC transporter membrane protein [Natronincola ferrireducens]